MLSKGNLLGFVPWLAIAWCFLGNQNFLKAQEKTKDTWADLKYHSAAKCGECHSLPRGNQLPSEDPSVKEQRAWDVVLMTEFSIWKSHDKHAQAYAVLAGPRGKRMGEILGQDVLKRETGCLSCHALGHLSEKTDNPKQFLLDGVSCGGCHGPSTKWLGDHAEPSIWRKKTAEEKQQLGLRDLRDPEVRSTVCVSCHIGNAAEGKIVTHAMFAAGHPPLPPIEIATFSRNEPQHWRDPAQVPLFKNASPEVAKNYHLADSEFFRTRLALVGALVSLRETARLAADRADFESKKGQELWPELLMGPDVPKDLSKLGNLAKDSWSEIAMAHSDCYACHHDLKYPGFRQVRGYGLHLAHRTPIRVSPGRPVLRTWPTALVQAALVASGQKIDELEKGLKDLMAACNERPFGNPASVRTAGLKLAGECDKAMAALRKSRLDRATVQKTMQEVLRLHLTPGPDGLMVTPDYESARQLASLLEVGSEELGFTGSKSIKGIGELAEILNLHPYQNRMPRVKEVLDAIARAADTPKADFKDDFFAYLSDISSAGKIKKLESNPNFIVTMIRLDNSKFNAELNKAPLIDKLQKYDDEEEVITLKSISDYGPDAFRQKLAEISKQLSTPAK
ncbi:MAG: hypothetical protein RL595_1209 [Planctomycetota bacterium]|jgi:hypothetical protein